MTRPHRHIINAFFFWRTRQHATLSEACPHVSRPPFSRSQPSSDRRRRHARQMFPSPSAIHVPSVASPGPLHTSSPPSPLPHRRSNRRAWPDVWTRGPIWSGPMQFRRRSGRCAPVATTPCASPPRRRSSRSGSRKDGSPVGWVRIVDGASETTADDDDRVTTTFRRSR